SWGSDPSACCAIAGPRVQSAPETSNPKATRKARCLIKVSTVPSSFITARGAPPPHDRASALEDSRSSRGPQALVSLSLSLSLIQTRQRCVGPRADLLCGGRGRHDRLRCEQ